MNSEEKRDADYTRLPLQVALLGFRVRSKILSYRIRASISTSSTVKLVSFLGVSIKTTLSYDRYAQSMYPY